MATMTPKILPAKNSRYSPTELNSNINPNASLKNLMSYIFSLQTNKIVKACLFDAYTVKGPPHLRYAAHTSCSASPPSS